MSIRTRVRAMAVLATALTVALTLAAPPAQAAFPGFRFVVRQGDFIAPTGTTPGATMSVESDGVHIHLDTPTDLVQATYPIDLPFADFNQYGKDPSYTWTGSATEPGIHYNIDLDGDGVADLELVGEHKYGTDLWLNQGYYRAHPTVPASVINGTAPCRGTKRQLADYPPLDCKSTAGDRFHGQMLEWIAGFYHAGYGDGSVVSAGFVATGGLVDGVLSDMRIGIAVALFTSNPRVPADLSIQTDVARGHAGDTVYVSGLASNTLNYPQVTLQEKDPGTAWRDIDHATLTTGAHYGFDVVLPDVAGIVRFRILVPSDSYNLRTLSPVVPVRVLP